jgi:hypothetical protein
VHFTKFKFLCKLYFMAMRNFDQYLRLVALLLIAATVPVTSPAGVHAQEPADTGTASQLDPRFGVIDGFVNTAETSAVGAGWSRVIFRWDIIQPAGSFDWKPANVPDPLLEAELAAGREVVAVLIGTPSWATESQTSTAVPPTQLWGNFVFQLANQYKGRIKHWVIWNQPDVDDPTSPSYTWAGSAEDYYRLLKEAYQKIKIVDPNMQVHVAGLTYTWDQERGNRQYLDRLLDIIVADPQAASENYYFDAVSYHLYNNPAQMLATLGDVRSILDAHGLGAKPIWITETNAPPSNDFIEPALGPATFSITLEEQSAFVVQAFALSLAGGAERIAFNKMRNEGNYANTVVPYGLLRGDNSRRPAFDAFRTVSTYFAGVRATSWLQLGDVFVVTLDRGGQTTTVLWNISTTPVNYALKAIAGEALLVDERGNTQPISAENGVYPIQLPGAVCSNGTYCFIGGAPRLIVESGSPDQRASLLPLAEPTPSPPPAPPPAETPLPTETPLLLPPTLTPTPFTAQDPVPISATDIPPAAAQSDPPQAGSLPAPSIEAAPPAADALPAPGVGEVPPAAGALPDPDFDPFSAETATDAAGPTPTIVPPVSLGTVLRPDRILWLLIIGLIVFTVSYGVQVAIWYRFRR